jgi:hypothetical protein
MPPHQRPQGLFFSPRKPKEGAAVKAQRCGQEKNKHPLVHSPPRFSEVVVCCPHREAGYDPQSCPGRKSLMDQDKIALFTEKVALYYDD